VLGGGYWTSSGCGKCWKVTGYSPITAASTTLVLKGSNLCPPSNPACADNKVHFSIAAPGFEFLGSSEAMGDEAAGFASCGLWMIRYLNPNENCDFHLLHLSNLRMYLLQCCFAAIDYFVLFIHEVPVCLRLPPMPARVLSCVTVAPPTSELLDLLPKRVKMIIFPLEQVVVMDGR